MKPQMFSDDDMNDMIARKVSLDRVPRSIRWITETTDFFRVDYDDIVMLDGSPYFIRQNEREGRFGI